MALVSRSSLFVLVAYLGIGPDPVWAEGRPITEGPHAMAATPALPAAVAQQRFTVPSGFEVRLFAAEPDVINPVAMTWDERGRLWVVELFEYPKKAPAGQKARDRIKIFEDTNNDGRADKVKVFADNLNLATGIARYGNGVIVGQAPELLYLEDTNGDDVADKRTVWLTGFSTEDTHELLNGFSWGPDGWMYLTHGVFNKSNVKSVGGDGAGTPMTAALARFHPRGLKFEIFADGTSNPWGVDFDRAGNAFVSACVIDHLFHLAPGGVYERQAGTPGDAFSYDLLPSIVDYKHFRAAYAGIQIYQGDQYPDDYQGMVVMGNIHANALNRDSVSPQGAGFKGKNAPDFLTSTDPWFRPVSEQTGPDGNLWIADWYDKYPCYQNARADPEGVDRTRGRIWRVVHTGSSPGAPRGSRRPAQVDLKQAATPLLVTQLADRNSWHRRVAQRILSERKDPSAKKPLLTLARVGKSLESRLSALWSLHGAGILDEATLDALVSDPDPAIRAWVARLSGERDAEPNAQAWVKGALVRLQKLAHDADPTVRAAVAVALRRMTARDTTAVLTTLAAQPGTRDDRVLFHLLWRAVEPRVAQDPTPLLTWVRDHGADNLLTAAELVRRTLRRLFDTGDPAKIDLAVAQLSALASSDTRLILAALQGVEEGQKGQSLRPRANIARQLRSVYARPEPEVVARARRLGAIWGDPGAARSILAVLGSRDPRVTERERIEAIEIAAGIPGPAARAALFVVLRDKTRPSLATSALRGLGKVGAEGTPQAVFAAWKGMPLETRTTALDVLSSRPAWALALLDAVAKKQVAAADLPAVVRRTLGRSGDRAVKDRAAAVLGRMRDTSSETGRLIADKRKVVLSGPVDFADGHEQAKKTCLLCHKFYGEGSDVGPDLTGVGRATLDALLTNVIDPNQVIGKGYEQVAVTTTDGRTISGRIVEDTPQRVTLVGLNLRETIPRKQIQSIDIGDVSVMPEGLEGLPDDQFRNLIWYIYQPPQDPNSRLRVELKDKKMELLVRGSDGKSWQPLLDYVMDPGLRPYIHPMRDGSGKNILTDDRPSDHVWQHGVFTGLHKVNGLDFWTEKQGKQRFKGLTDLQQETDRVLWKSRTEWVAPTGDVLLDEEQAFTVYAPTGTDGYTVDIDWNLKAREKAVQFGASDYGGLSLRMPLHKDHKHLNARDQRGADTNVQRAAWTTVERPFPDGSIWGAAIMDHPGNDRHPAAWRVDAQGLINPSPSISGDWSIPEWRNKKFRYRMVVFKGPANAQKLKRHFESFAAVPFVAGR